MTPGDDTTALLEARDLECWRGDRRLFTAVNLKLARGEAVQLAGPNGSGKTTLLRAICGLTRVERGELRWRGRPVADHFATYRADIVYIGHENGLKFELTPLENLRALRDIAVPAPGVTPEQALARTGLAGYEHRPVRTLSSGQRRRVALSRLPLTKAALWLLDEPFTALDDQGAALVHALVETHLESGGGVVFTSHIPLALTRGEPHRLMLGT